MRHFFEMQKYGFSKGQENIFIVFIKIDLYFLWFSANE